MKTFEIPPEMQSWLRLCAPLFDSLIADKDKHGNYLDFPIWRVVSGKQNGEEKVFLAAWGFSLELGTVGRSDRWECNMECL